VDPTLLRHFVVAAEELHFAHAAKKLDVPRSAVIASVRKLEAVLGYELFDDTASTTTLTDAGEAFVADAKRQLSKSAAAAKASAAPPGGKAKASKGKGRTPAVKGQPRVGKRRQSR
jgi:DNA-binding transcriptional LysR family regulator